MLEENKRLIVAGASMLPLRPKTKRPFDDEWSTQPRQGLVALKKRFEGSNYNIGIRLGKWSRIDGGYVLSFDVDIHDEAGEAEAWAELERLFGKIVHKLPMQKSGSAGASFHLFFACESHFPSVNIVQSDRQVRRKNGKLGPAWSIDLFGTGKQVAMAPSIHPDTGNAYRWIRPINPHDIPEIEPAVLTPFVFREEGDQHSDDVIGLSQEEVREYVARLPDWHADDREKWIEAGMAIKHELGDAGLPIFVEFSKRNPAKYKREDEFGRAGPKVVKQQYKSIKNRETRGRLITMRTVIAAVHDHEDEMSMRENFEEFEELPAEEPDEFTKAPRPLSKREIMRLFDDDDGDDDEKPRKTEVVEKPRKGDPDLSILNATSEPAPIADFDYIFGRDIAKIIRDTAINSKTSPDYVMGGLLFAISTAIGNGIKVALTPTFLQPAACWAMIVGGPSTKKTPGIGSFSDALTEIEADHMAVWNIAHERWLEDKEIADGVLKDWKAKAKAARIAGEEAPARPQGAEAPPMPVQPRLISNDCTIEALFRLMVRQPHGIGTYREELGQWFDDMDGYSGTSSRGYHLQSYDAKSQTSDRVKDEGRFVHVKRFYQSIVGGIQPERLLGVTSRQHADDGLVARFIPFWPDRTYVSAHAEAPVHTNRITRMLRKLIEGVKTEDGEPKVLPFSRAASRHFKDWVDAKERKEGSISGRLGGIFGKSDGLIGRIALWLWAVEWGYDYANLKLPDEIGIEYVKRAIYFRDSYIKPMQIRVWKHATESEERKNTRHVAEWIVENRPQGDINLSKLRREAGIPGINSRTRAEEMEEVAKMLVSMRWIYPIEEDKRGRGAPAKNYGINERLWELLGIKH